MKRALLAIAVLSTACTGYVRGQPRRGVANGGGGNEPFVQPYKIADSGTPYGYTQQWNAETPVDEACVSDLLVRARWLLLGKIDGVFPVGFEAIPPDQVGLLFDSSTVWFFPAGAPLDPDTYSAVQNETLPAWAELGNFESAQYQGGTVGHIEVESYGRAIVHNLLHHYEVHVLGKSVLTTMRHEGWEANHFAQASDLFARMVDPTRGLPCFPR